jgi:hypothetical protein
VIYVGEAGYEFLGEALAEAAAGDASQLLEAADRYTGRRSGGVYDGSMAAFYAIGCVDSTRLSLDEVRTLSDTLAVESPYLGPANAWLGLPCAYWPVPFDPAAEPHPATVPDGTPMLVATNIGDGVTPIEWARALAAQLDAPLLVADSAEHGAFTGGDPCIQGAIIDFLEAPDGPVADCDDARDTI